MVCFNPRSREGSDRAMMQELTFNTVSIHAPAKGATESFWIQSCRSSVSIHAPAKGATNEFGDIKPKTIGFNPRSREGSDGELLDPELQIFCFNPRSREGSDAFRTMRILLHSSVSIHAPAKGATKGK